jgi:TRAP-type C4-dicarboxylate transport system substrate-binding protein
MNLDKWNSLPPDIQKTIMSFSGIPGAEFAGDALCDTAAVDTVYAMAKQAGKTIEEVPLDPGEFDKWVKIIQPMYDKWVADMAAKGLPAQKLLDAARALVAKYK